MRKPVVFMILTAAIASMPTAHAQTSPVPMTAVAVEESGSSAKVQTSPMTKLTDLRKMQERSAEMLRAVMDDVPSASPTLKWPDKRITLDVKDASIRRVAEMLGEQSGITFTVKEAVPSGLKITIQVGSMGVKPFLDTLCAATNLTYMAESRAKETEAKVDESGNPKAPVVVSRQDIYFTTPQVGLVPTGEGYEMVSPGGQKIVILNTGVGQPVTNVTISSLAAEGVVVNMGTVSMSVKNADPIDVATRLIKQIDGASYIMMDLKDYLELQDPERADEVAKAVQALPRKKVTLTLRNVMTSEALNTLAEKGNFYIGNPQGGQSNYLIIPDVKVTDTKVMPGLSAWPMNLVFDSINSPGKVLLRRTLTEDK